MAIVWLSKYKSLIEDEPTEKFQPQLIQNIIFCEPVETFNLLMHPSIIVI